MSLRLNLNFVSLKILSKNCHLTLYLMNQSSQLTITGLKISVCEFQSINLGVQSKEASSRAIEPLVFGFGDQ